MRTRERRAASVALLLVAGAAFPAGKAERRYGLGRSIAEADVASWNIDVRPDGAGLPPGRGTVAQGKEVYLAKCSACHGENGEGSPMDRLVGGAGTLASDKPVKTVGSYWPYATTLFDYVRRTMPFTDPHGLSADETYAVTAPERHRAGVDCARCPHAAGRNDAQPPRLPTGRPPRRTLTPMTWSYQPSESS